jgi:hypothetical protein
VASVTRTPSYGAHAAITGTFQAGLAPAAVRRGLRAGFTALTHKSNALAEQDS